MTNKVKDENLKEAVGGKHIPYHKDDESDETLYSFTSGEKLYTTMNNYYQVKQSGSFRYDEDVLCDSYSFMFGVGFKLTEQDVKIKATVLNTCRNNKF